MNTPGIQFLSKPCPAQIPTSVIPAKRSAVPESHLFWHMAER